MHLPALIFDYGNVVAFFDYGKAFERMGAPVGLSAALIRQRLDDGGFAHVLREFESGRLAPHSFAERVMSLAGLSLPYDCFVGDWEDIFWLNESVVRLVRSLDDGGYPLFLGSNTNILHAPYFRRKFAGILERFDALVLSYEVGHCKPEREFYDACVTAAGAAASSCIFIDDVMENVEGARRAGLEAVQYTGTDRLVVALQDLGVDIPPVAW